MSSQFFSSIDRDPTINSIPNLPALSHNLIILCAILIIVASILYLISYKKRKKLFNELIPQLGTAGATLYMALKYQSPRYLPLENLESAGIIRTIKKTVTDKEGKTSTSISRKWPHLQGIHRTHEGVGILMTPLPGSLTALMNPNTLVELCLSLDSDIIPVDGGMVFIITQPSKNYRNNFTTEGES